MGAPELAAQIGREARRVAETHSWDQVAHRYEELLAPLLGDGDSG
jgi:hypothetical protein